MSQLYRVQLKTSVSETFTLSDRIVHQIELTHILPEEEMKDLLKEALEADGFEQKEDGSYHKKGQQGEDIIFDIEQMQLTASLEEEKALQTEATATGQAWDSQRTAREHAQNLLEAAAESARSQLETESKQLQKQLSKRLEQGEKDRQRALHELLQRVYAESLKRKAEQLGDITSIHEGTHQGEYELVIHIEQ